MAIYKKDKSFSNILEDIQFDNIPIEYIHWIVLHLTDGRKLKIIPSELKNITDTDNLFDDPRLEAIGPIVDDIEIVMDSDKLKNNVMQYVNSVLGKHFKE